MGRHFACHGTCKRKCDHLVKMRIFELDVYICWNERAQVGPNEGSVQQSRRARGPPATNQVQSGLEAGVSDSKGDKRKEAQKFLI